jgi:hypothetical protein
MSIHVMSAVWKLNLPDSEKLIMLALIKRQLAMQAFECETGGKVAQERTDRSRCVEIARSEGCALAGDESWQRHDRYAKCWDAGVAA